MILELKDRCSIVITKSIKKRIRKYDIDYAKYVHIRSK